MKINELEDLLGVSRATIRYYEDQGLVTPPRTANGYRDYSDEEVWLFQKIIVLRKLGVSVPEIKDLIEGKADLQDVLEQNVDRLRSQQDEIAAAIEMTRIIETESADFDSIDSPKYLRTIYESEQKGSHFAEAKEISARQLNLSITLLAALGGVALPQNNRYRRGNEPIPEDIRGNKKEGDEYDTIGDVLNKGGKRKVIVIAAAVLLIGFLLFHGIIVWGGLGSSIKSAREISKAGISPFTPGKSELEEIIEIDPEARDADFDFSGLYKFHTQGGLILTLKHLEDGSWTDVYTETIDNEEGLLFVTGDPSSEIAFHIIADANGQVFRTKLNDSTYREKDLNYRVLIMDQKALNKEQTINLYYADDYACKILDDNEVNYYPEDVLELELPDGCYAVTAQSMQ